MRGTRFVLALSVSALLAGCGTLVNGGSQTVDVIVKGTPNAYCDFTTSVTRNAGTFPNKLNVERSKEPLKADCRGEQNLTKVFIIEPKLTAAGTVGNIPTGILPGVGYDAASGGMWAYPDPIILDFRVIGKGPEPKWPADKADAADAEANARMGTADITPPTPIHMQPIMDDQLNPALDTQTPATAKPEVIDAVRLAVDHEKPAVVAPYAAKKSSTAAPVVKSSSKMKPIASPEDDPAVQKAKAAEKAKAEAEAKRKAAAKAEAQRKQAAAAKAKAAAAKAEAEKPVQSLPEATTPAPEAPAAPATSSVPAEETTTAPAAVPEFTAPQAVPAAPAASPSPSATPAPAPSTGAPAPATGAPTPVTPQSSNTTAPGAQNVGAENYLQGQAQ